MFERVEKNEGSFIALYACEMGELGEKYLGHYKIFPTRPSDFWVPGHIAADIVGRLSPSAHEALADARDLAAQHVRRLALQWVRRSQSAETFPKFPPRQRSTSFS